jgi:hypothetical protein
MLIIHCWEFRLGLCKPKLDSVFGSVWVQLPGIPHHKCGCVVNDLTWGVRTVLCSIPEYNPNTLLGNRHELTSSSLNRLPLCLSCLFWLCIPRVVYGRHVLCLRCLRMVLISEGNPPLPPSGPDFRGIFFCLSFYDDKDWHYQVTTSDPMSPPTCCMFLVFWERPPHPQYSTRYSPSPFQKFAVYTHVLCVLLPLENLLWVKLRDYAVSRVNPNPRQVFLVRVVKMW